MRFCFFEHFPPIHKIGTGLVPAPDERQFAPVATVVDPVVVVGVQRHGDDFDRCSRAQRRFQKRSETPFVRRVKHNRIEDGNKTSLSVWNPFRPIVFCQHARPKLVEKDARKNWLKQPFYNLASLASAGHFFVGPVAFANRDGSTRRCQARRDVRSCPNDLVTRIRTLFRLLSQVSFVVLHLGARLFFLHESTPRQRGHITHTMLRAQLGLSPRRGRPVLDPRQLLSSWPERAQPLVGLVGAHDDARFADVFPLVERRRPRIAEYAPTTYVGKTKRKRKQRRCGLSGRHHDNDENIDKNADKNKNNIQKQQRDLPGWSHENGMAVRVVSRHTPMGLTCGNAAIL